MLIDSLKSLVQFVCMDCWKVNDANRQPIVPSPVCLSGCIRLDYFYYPECNPHGLREILESSWVLE